jgi:ABC-2 type transport system permease protein
MSGWRTLFPNAWYIAVREYRSRVRSKTFVLGTLLLACIAFAVAQAPILIDFAQSTSKTSIAVYDQAGDLPSDAPAVLDQALNGQAVAPGSTGNRPYAVSWFQGGGLDSVQRQLEDGEFGALLIIDRDSASGDLTFVLRTDMPSDGRGAQAIGNAVYSLAVEDRLIRAGTSTAAVLAPVKWEVDPVSSSGTTTTKSLTMEISSSVISTLLIVLIFMAIITYGTWVAMGVAEEKGSRVMELMLNATTPLQMLAGKVIGNGAAGLTQYSVVIASAVAGFLAQGQVRQLVLGSSEGASPFAGLEPIVFAAFVVLFVLGFLLYSMLYAALGSLVSRQEDVQAATSPLMFIIVAGYMLSVFGLQAIDETWVVLLSYVPFFSPYLMLARVAVGHVELWEFGLAVVLMLATSAVALFAAARIYSAGVLLYGQRVGLRQILKAARAKR